MTRMTTLQISQLDRMNEASRKAGGIGTRIDTLEYGTAEVPSAGTVVSAPIVHYAISNAYIGTATKMHAAVTLASGATTTVTTAITNPDYPRILSVKGNDGNVTGNCVFTGTDINGDALTETIVASGSSEDFGTKAFKTVTQIVLPAYAVAGTETISIGMGDKFGFPIAISNDALVISKNFDGATDAGTVTVGATAARSLYAVAGTLNGAKDVDLWFIAA